MTEVQGILEKVTAKYGKQRTALMPALQAIVKEKHYLNDEDIVEVAKAFDLSTAEVYGTASFYTFLDTVPRGQYVIRICKTIACHMSGKDEVIEALSNMLKVKVGETTVDKKFSLLTTNCLGWCHKGPAMLVNDEVYTELTPQKAIEIIQSYQQK
jgi:NADH:ubiquinone oxidoreductase subunit E